MDWAIAIIACVAVVLLVVGELVSLLVIAGFYRTTEALRGTNKTLAEQIVAARKALAETRVPVNMHVTDEQLANLALAINNVREAINLPKEQVH